MRAAAASAVERVEIAMVSPSVERWGDGEPQPPDRNPQTAAHKLPAHWRPRSCDVLGDLENSGKRKPAFPASRSRSWGPRGPDGRKTRSDALAQFCGQGLENFAPALFRLLEPFGSTPSWVRLSSHPFGRGLRSIVTRVCFEENFGTQNVRDEPPRAVDLNIIAEVLHIVAVRAHA